MQKQNGEWILYAAAGNSIEDGGEFADNADNDEGGVGHKKSGAASAAPESNIFGESSDSGNNIFGTSSEPAVSVNNNIFGTGAANSNNNFGVSSGPDSGPAANLFGVASTGAASSTNIFSQTKPAQ